MRVTPFSTATTVLVTSRARLRWARMPSSVAEPVGAEAVATPSIVSRPPESVTYTQLRRRTPSA